MAEIVGYQFDRVFSEPLELYRKVDTIAERDAIPTGKRYQGMLCYVVSENEDYQLRTGITNVDWVASGIGNFFNKSVDDSDDITEGATNLFMNTTEQTKLGYITVTQAVDLDQLEIDVAALSGGVVFKGVWSPSGGVFPGGGTSAIGDLYIADDSGTIDGISFVAGDGVIATVVNASTTVFSGNWAKTESTSDVTSVVGLTGAISKTALLSALNVEDGATADMTGAELVTAINNELTVTTWQNPLTKEQVLDYIGEAINAGTQTNITVTYDDASDSIDFNVAPSLDAATLDGLDSTQFLRSDTDDTMNGRLTISDINFQLLTLSRTSDLNVQVFMENSTYSGYLGVGNTSDLRWGSDTNATNNPKLLTDASNSVDPKYLRSDVADTKTAGDLTFNDNVKIALGTGGAESDISSDGVDTNVNLKSGNLILYNNAVEIARLNRATGNWSFGNTNNTYKLDVSGTGRFTGQVIVPADAYDAGWNGDNTAPTKNDVYDEMETKATESSGTSTPTLIAATSGSYSIGGTQICNYVKIGKLVHVNFRLTNITSTSPVGAFRIDLNLPFSYTVVGDNFLNVGYIRNTSLTTSEIDSIRLQLSSSSFASFSDSDASSYTNVTFTAGTGEVSGSGTFQIS